VYVLVPSYYFKARMGGKVVRPTALANKHEIAVALLSGYRAKQSRERID
jgi:starvation-inducible outer membrane lipoprotein